jgi:hypothetical protein
MHGGTAEIMIPSFVPKTQAQGLAIATPFFYVFL